MNTEFTKSCDFIKKELTFMNYQDFRENAEAIKSLFLEQETTTRQLYKWYVYAQTFKMYLKDQIWEYLNGDVELQDLPIK